VDDIAALLAEAIARRVKDAQAAKKAAPARYAGTAAPKAAGVPAPVAPKLAAPKAVAPAPLPRPAPPPVNPPSSADDVFAIAAAADAPSASVLLNAFRGPGSFLTAFVLHEALGKPVALREDGPLF
jgi:hypothetical protein